MENNTFLIEEKNFGNAQQAYTDFPNVENKFTEKFESYQKLVNDLSRRELSKIQLDEMKTVDDLSKEVETSFEVYHQSKEILVQYCEEMLQECSSIVDQLNYQSENMKNSDKANYPLNLIQEAKEYKDNNQIMEAMDKAYSAKENLKTVLYEIMQEWLASHKKYIGALTARDNFDVSRSMLFSQSMSTAKHCNIILEKENTTKNVDETLLYHEKTIDSTPWANMN